MTPFKYGEDKKMGATAGNKRYAIKKTHNNTKIISAVCLVG
jgi:hypothetical protein